MNVDAGVGRQWAVFLPYVITPAKEAVLDCVPVSHTEDEVLPRASSMQTSKTST